jgi:putative hydrolase of HD superfamily
MLNKDFIEFLYEAAHIQRWNDHIRPNGFTELDKQAHKMMILYVLARYEEQDHGAKLNWRALVEGGIMEFLHRIVLTDIKPPVFHQLMRAHGKELNQWVYDELHDLLATVDKDFPKKMKKYFR